jgi:hypothetical protein
MVAALATATIAVLPATSASAASVHVLTTKKAGGPAVAARAVLKAGLAPHTSAVFKNSLGKVTCMRSTVTEKVIANPAKTARPATASESMTAVTFSSCKINVSGVTFKSLTVANLPYNVTVSDAKGNPVKISGRSKAKPLMLAATVKFGAATISCSVKAASIAGTWSNKGNVIVIVTRNFKKASGGSLCPTSGTLAATYGPVKDTSVKGSPAVFVN